MASEWLCHHGQEHPSSSMATVLQSPMKGHNTEVFLADTPGAACKVVILGRVVMPVVGLQVA
jgi:hypothetical protein